MRMILKILGFIGLMLAAGLAFVYFHDLIIFERKAGRGAIMSDAQFFTGLGFLAASLFLAVVATLQVMRPMKWLSLLALIISVLVFVGYGIMFFSVDQAYGQRPDVVNLFVVLVPSLLALCPVLHAWFMKPPVIHVVTNNAIIEPVAAHPAASEPVVLHTLHPDPVTNP